MSQAPETSITLLKSITGNEKSVRWYEFYQKYSPLMRAYLAAHYPSVSADDIVMITLENLVKSLPDYVYEPDKTGHFRSYLIGIVKHKALDVIRSENRETARRDRLAKRQKVENGNGEPTMPVSEDEVDLKQRQMEIFEVALAQLMADPHIQERNREIFRRVAIMHEKPEAVAAAFNIERNNVDAIKKRMITKLQAIVKGLNRLYEI